MLRGVTTFTVKKSVARNLAGNQTVIYRII